MPGGTTTSPSGLSRSLATFAMNFEVPIPTEAVSPPVTSVTRDRSSSAKAVTAGSDRSASPGCRSGSAAARSTNASSSESGSTSGETERSSRITWSLAAR